MAKYIDDIMAKIRELSEVPPQRVVARRLADVPGRAEHDGDVRHLLAFVEIRERHLFDHSLRRGSRYTAARA